MKRFPLGVSVLTLLLSGVLLARAAWRDHPGVRASQRPASNAVGSPDGAAGWHYRHSQPTHWRSCMLQP